MCRYAFHRFRDHLVCFRCRKMFRPRELPISLVERRIHRCPDCRDLVHDMGLDFSPPDRNNLKQWRKVQLLHVHGLTYRGCGCGGSGPRAATLREAREFVKLNSRAVTTPQKELAIHSAQHVRKKRQ